MTAVYFVIAALAAIGAAALLWLDRRRIATTRRERAVWGDGHGFRYVAAEGQGGESEPPVRDLLHRATMDVAADAEIRDLTFGRHYGEMAVVFDIVDVATVVAVRRSSESAVVIDLRQEKVLVGHQRWVWDCAFSADSAYLVTGEWGLIFYEAVPGCFLGSGAGLVFGKRDRVGFCEAVPGCFL